MVHSKLWSYRLSKTHLTEIFIQLDEREAR